ncbi:MAG: hypothetical protein P4L41_09060 [Flavipsychrobacter sp.]|nr:hypothetical protein [Flavipsychrobacter sp.]
MKSRFIKTIFLSALSTIVAFSAVTYTSCTPDKCKSVVCAYGGVCSGGSCICQSGYEGTQCEYISRAKFLGVWQVVETGTITNVSHYAVTIDADTDPSSSVTNVTISNFYNSITTKVNAYVKGDTLIIPQITYNGNVIQGYGVIQQEGTIYAQHAQMSVYYSVTNAQGLVNDFGTEKGSASIWSK